MIKRFEEGGHGFQIEVEIQERPLRKNAFIPLHKVTLSCPEDNFSTYLEVPSEKLRSTISRFMTKTAPEWVNAYSLKGSNPSPEELLLSQLGFEDD